MSQELTAAALVTPEMTDRAGRWSDTVVASPVAASDIRRWAIATYWPEEPPPVFWDERLAASTAWGGLVAPEDFNPFAWPARRSERATGTSGSGLAVDVFGVPVPHRRGAAPPAGSPRIGGMNAGRADEFGARIRPGDVIMSRERLVDWREETTRLGPSLFARVEVEWTNQHGALVRRRLQTMLRYFPDVEARSAGGEPRPEPPASEFPAWSRTTDLESWNRYAAVNDEYVDIHMSDEAGRRAGNPEGAFGMGNLRYGYLVNALRAWFGEAAVIRALSCQFRALNRKGDTLTVVGVTSGVLPGERGRVHSLRVDVVNQAGVSTCPGAAEVYVPGTGPG